MKVNRTIYLARNRINNKVYVGRSKYGLQMRRRTHEYAAERYKRDPSVVSGIQRFDMAIAKWGINGFEWVILQDEIDTDVRLYELEELYIEKYGACDSHKGYNLSPGGFADAARFQLSICPPAKVRKVRCKTTNIVYSNILEALFSVRGSAIGIARLHEACIGKRKLLYNLEWEYVG